MIHVRSISVVLFIMSLLSTHSIADTTLTFEHVSASNGSVIPQVYGDNVTTTPDANGHRYFIGNVLGLGTPNVSVSYAGGTSNAPPTTWISGFGDLNVVLNNEFDGDDELSMTFSADAGFEVGLLGFDVAAFQEDEVLPGLQILDGVGNLLFGQGPTLISGSTHNDFNFTNGLFASQITVKLDLTGLGQASDNIGIDNVNFVQAVVVVPEPGTCTGFFLATSICCLRRKRRGI